MGKHGSLHGGSGWSINSHCNHLNRNENKILKLVMTLFQICEHAADPVTNK